MKGGVVFTDERRGVVLKNLVCRIDTEIIAQCQATHTKRFVVLSDVTPCRLVEMYGVVGADVGELTEYLWSQRHACWRTVTDVSEEISASVFRVQRSSRLLIYDFGGKSTTILRNVGNFRPTTRRHIPQALNLCQPSHFSFPSGGTVSVTQFTV